MEYAGLNIFLVLLFLGLLINIFALPGPIFILVAAIFFFIITNFKAIGITAIIGMTILAALAETVDYLLGTRGAYPFRFSASSLGMGALLGTAAALAFTPVIYGPGLILGIFLGGLTGVFLVELINMGRLRPSLRNYRSILLNCVAVISRGVVSMAMIAIILDSIYS